MATSTQFAIETNPVLFEHLFQIATSFMRGTYNVGSVVHSFYQFNLATTVEAWARAIMETQDIRPHAFVEFRLLARIFIKIYFGDIANSPCWASRAFELFSYRLIVRVTPRAPKRVPMLLDMIGALRDLLVVPVSSPILASMMVLETVRESVVYEQSLPAWAIQLGECIASRVLTDHEATQHAVTSDPILQFFMRIAHSTDHKTPSTMALVRQAMRLNHTRVKETHRAAVSDCLFRQNKGRIDPVTSAVCFTNSSLKRERADRLRFAAKRPRSVGAPAIVDRKSSRDIVSDCNQRQAGSKRRPTSNFLRKLAD